MRVVIAQSFSEPEAALFHIGEVLDVPEDTAERWFASKRAVPLGKAPGTASPQKPVAVGGKPVLRREKAVKPASETR